MIVSGNEGTARGGRIAAPVSRTSTTNAATGGQDWDFANMLGQWQAQGGSSFGRTAPVVVPLWRARPKRPTATSDSGLDKYRRQKAKDAEYLRALAAEGRDPDDASTSFLDMDPAEREEFKRMAVAAGIIDADATPQQVANAWANQVGVAADYNRGKAADKWISPWEAVEKLGVAQIAAEGGRWNGYSGYVGKVDRTVKTVQTYTEADLAGNAEQILRQTLGRSPGKDEVEKYLAAVNAAAKSNPLVERTTGSIDAGGNENTTVSRSGGIDPNQIILEMARQDPEFAPVQAATTYFEAAMQALDSIV